MYNVKIITDETGISDCTPFYIDHLLWGTKRAANTYGRLGFIKNEGLFLTMTCEEANPMRIFYEENTPVYLDSAMEAFFCFDKKSGIYLNFEMNANGALLAMYGPKRIGRKTFPMQLHHACMCQAQVNASSWSLSLRISLSLLTFVYGQLELQEGLHFTCNFYKISETASIEHYSSFSPILTEKPDFHRPEYFSDAVIVL